MQSFTGMLALNTKTKKYKIQDNKTKSLQLVYMLAALWGCTLYHALRDGVNNKKVDGDRKMHQIAPNTYCKSYMPSCLKPNTQDK